MSTEFSQAYVHAKSLFNACRFPEAAQAFEQAVTKTEVVEEEIQARLRVAQSHFQYILRALPGYVDDEKKPKYILLKHVGMAIGPQIQEPYLALRDQLNEVKNLIQLDNSAHLLYKRKVQFYFGVFQDVSYPFTPEPSVEQSSSEYQFFNFWARWLDKPDYDELLKIVPGHPGYHLSLFFAEGVDEMLHRHWLDLKHECTTVLSAGALKPSAVACYLPVIKHTAAFLERQQTGAEAQRLKSIIQSMGAYVPSEREKWQANKAVQCETPQDVESYWFATCDRYQEMKRIDDAVASLPSIGSSSQEVVDSFALMITQIKSGLPSPAVHICTDFISQVNESLDVQQWRANQPMIATQAAQAARLNSLCVQLINSDYSKVVQIHELYTLALEAPRLMNESEDKFARSIYAILTASPDDRESCIERFISSTAQYFRSLTDVERKAKVKHLKQNLGVVLSDEDSKYELIKDSQRSQEQMKQMTRLERWRPLVERRDFIQLETQFSELYLRPFKMAAVARNIERAKQQEQDAEARELAVAKAELETVVASIKALSDSLAQVIETFPNSFKDTFKMLVNTPGNLLAELNVQEAPQNVQAVKEYITYLRGQFQAALKRIPRVYDSQMRGWDVIVQHHGASNLELVKRVREHQASEREAQQGFDYLIENLKLCVEVNRWINGADVSTSAAASGLLQQVRITYSHELRNFVLDAKLSAQEQLAAIDVYLLNHFRTALRAALTEHVDAQYQPEIWLAYEQEVLADPHASFVTVQQVGEEVDDAYRYAREKAEKFDILKALLERLYPDEEVQPIFDKVILKLRPKIQPAPESALARQQVEDQALIAMLDVEIDRKTEGLQKLEAFEKQFRKKHVTATFTHWKAQATREACAARAEAKEAQRVAEEAAAVATAKTQDDAALNSVVKLVCDPNRLAQVMWLTELTQKIKQSQGPENLLTIWQEKMQTAQASGHVDLEENVQLIVQGQRILEIISLYQMMVRVNMLEDDLIRQWKTKVEEARTDCYRDSDLILEGIAILKGNFAHKSQEFQELYHKMYKQAWNESVKEVIMKSLEEFQVGMGHSALEALEKAYHQGVTGLAYCDRMWRSEQKQIERQLSSVEPLLQMIKERQVREELQRHFTIVKDKKNHEALMEFHAYLDDANTRQALVALMKDPKKPRILMDKEEYRIAEENDFLLSKFAQKSFLISVFGVNKWGAGPRGTFSENYVVQFVQKKIRGELVDFVGKEDRKAGQETLILSAMELVRVALVTGSLPDQDNPLKLSNEQWQILNGLLEEATRHKEQISREYLAKQKQARQDERLFLFVEGIFDERKRVYDERLTAQVVQVPSVVDVTTTSSRDSSGSSSSEGARQPKKLEKVVTMTPASSTGMFGVSTTTTTTTSQAAQHDSSSSLTSVDEFKPKKKTKKKGKIGRRRLVDIGDLEPSTSASTAGAFATGELGGSSSTSTLESPKNPG